MFNCLRTNHKSQDCSSSKNCCFVSGNIIGQFVKLAALKIPTLHQTLNPHQEANSVTITAKSLKGKCTILLQTAQAIAVAINNSAKMSQQVLVLFKSESESVPT